MFAVLDTNHFREYAQASPSGGRLMAKIEVEKPDLFTCIVTAEESLGGWLALVRQQRAGLDQLKSYERLHACIETLGKLTMLPFDREAAMIFHELARTHPRVGKMDLKIASICLEHDATLLTRNLVDFEKIPGLNVENWLD